MAPRARRCKRLPVRAFILRVRCATTALRNCMRARAACWCRAKKTSGLRLLKGTRRVRVHRIPRLPGWQLGNQLEMLAVSRALVRRAKFDVVHADAGTLGGRADVLVVHTVTARWLDLPAAREPGVRGLNAAAATRFK